MWNKLLAYGGIVSSDGKIWWSSVDAMNGEDYLKNIKEKSTKLEDYLPARDFLRPYIFSLLVAVTIKKEHLKCSFFIAHQLLRINIIGQEIQFEYKN